MKRILRLPTSWLLLVLLLSVALVSAFAIPPAQEAKPYEGKVLQTLTNCGLTQVFGIVLDENDQPLPGVNLRLWWAGGDVLRTQAGNYVRPETNSSGWDFVLDIRPIKNDWFVAVDDGADTLLSEPVEIHTDGTCNDGDANVINMEFRIAPRKTATPIPPSPTSTPLPTLPPLPPSSEVAPIVPTSLPSPSPTATPTPEVVPLITEGAICSWYTETTITGGFSVCDDDNANFLTAYYRLGIQNLGFPISRRFYRHGFMMQAFQKGIMQWMPDAPANRVELVNVFDELHNEGFDHVLFETRRVPYQLLSPWDASTSFEQAVEERQALLNARPAIHDAYFASSDPIFFFGLPSSEIEDMGSHFAMRLQRTVLQEWKEDMPWAKAGEVSLANSGDIAREFGIIPQPAIIPESSSPGAAPMGPPSAVQFQNQSEYELTIELADFESIVLPAGATSAPLFLWAGSYTYYAFGNPTVVTGYIDTFTAVPNEALTVILTPIGERATLTVGNQTNCELTFTMQGPITYPILVPAGQKRAVNIPNATYAYNAEACGISGKGEFSGSEEITFVIEGSVPAAPKSNCDPSYPTVCIPSPPPELDCADIPYQDFLVVPPDPHHFDRDGDGRACED